MPPDGFNGLGVDETPHLVGCPIVRRINGDGVELAVTDEGDGPAVLLIHGFPDSARVWRHQIPALTNAGRRVIAPDLRGFGASGHPDDVGDYRVGRSVADLIAVLDALGVERAHVVGHDWGAAVAWALALMAPGRVERLTVMSVGHPTAYARRTVSERERSWYMLLFQFPEAEELLRRDGWKLLRAWAATHPDLDDVIADLERPGALTAALNWYRANVHPRNELEPPPPLPPVAADTLGLWSSGDAYLEERAMKESGEYVSGDWRYERIDGASHWMQLDAPDRINELLC
jgi:pimeloyl-ACP methyl ester carboxylesterase